MERDQFYISLLSYPKFNGTIDFEETVIITTRISAIHLSVWSSVYSTDFIQFLTTTTITTRRKNIDQAQRSSMLPRATEKTHDKYVLETPLQ